MRAIKLGLISIVILFIVITGISLLMPSRIIISRAIDISAPFDTVYNNIAELSNWKKWYPVNDTATFLVSAIHAGEGATVKIDKATILIKKMTPRKIEGLWIEGATKEFLPAEFNFLKTEGTDHMTVQWQFIHNVKWYPWEKFASIVSNSSIGTFMEQSLENLKETSENR